MISWDGRYRVEPGCGPTVGPFLRLDDAVLQVVEVLGVVDDLDLVGIGRTDAGQAHALLLDFFVAENLLHVHVDLALEDDGCAVRAGTGAAREGPVVALGLGGLEDVLALVDVERTVILVVEARVGGLLEEVVVVHVPALVVQYFVVEVFYRGHHASVRAPYWYSLLFRPQSSLSQDRLIRTQDRQDSLNESGSYGESENPSHGRPVDYNDRRVRTHGVDHVPAGSDQNPKI